MAVRGLRTFRSMGIGKIQSKERTFALRKGNLGDESRGGKIIKLLATGSLGSIVTAYIIGSYREKKKYKDIERRLIAGNMKFSQDSPTLTSRQID